MKPRLMSGVVAAGLCVGALASATSAAARPAVALKMPGPASGATLQTVAKGVTTPTAFAFGAGHIFVSDGTLPQGPTGPFVGGVYVLSGGAAIRLSGSPTAAFGVTWHKRKLYVSAITTGPHGLVSKLLCWSRWNGARFATHKLLYTAPAGIVLNGLAFGADGRLYVGVDVGVSNDHGSRQGLLYDVLSFSRRGEHMKVLATGIRQPWQLAFPAGSSSPFVTDLGQDTPQKVANTSPDFILRVRSGQDYGFPNCDWVRAPTCSAYATPLKFLGPHTDPGGLGIIGTRLYFSEFGFVRPAKVQSMRLRGGALKTLLTGFRGESFIGLGTHNGWVYVGEGATPRSGRVFRVKP